MKREWIMMRISCSIPAPAPAPAMEEGRLRRLILLRHAQSCWEDSSLRDHDRPLTKSGVTDAIQLSYKLNNLNWIPQLILSSDALRTRQTLQIMQEHVPAFSKPHILFISSFYSIAAMDGHTPIHLQQTISKYATPDIHTVMCIGHNRGWEEAASTFSASKIKLNTCNAALLQASAPSDSWDQAFLLGPWNLQQLINPNSTP